MVNDADSFVAEFVRISQLLPQTGLIIDVRGNGGGNILAGERLLQVLTPQPIEPERFHFINTPATLELCQGAPAELGRWARSIGLAIETGEMYSQGFALEPVERYNRVGQQYQGPVVLIIDALCYSTTDIFTAGFQDHRIGKVIGTSRHTGAGGANVWQYSQLQDLLPARFGPLPKGAGFSAALRRCTRVRDQAGVPVEDLGVVPEDVHLMTRGDVLEGNINLIAKAASLLAAESTHSLAAELDRSHSPEIVVQAGAQNISRIDFYRDGRPVASVGGSGTLELRGFEGGNLVAVAKVAL